MNTEKYLFAQLIEFLSQIIFDRVVMTYEENKHVMLLPAETNCL